MSILSALDQRVTIQRIGSSGTDDWNNPTTDVTGTDEYAGRLVPVDSQETLVGRDTVVVNLMLWLEPRAVVAATDRAVVNGETFEIMADPIVQRTTKPAIHHVEVPVQRVVSG